MDAEIGFRDKIERASLKNTMNCATTDALTPGNDQIALACEN